MRGKTITRSFILQLLVGLTLLSPSQLSAQTEADSLHLRVRTKLDSLLSKGKDNFYWPQPKGGTYELKSAKRKRLTEVLSPLVIEAVHSPKIQHVDSADFAGFLAERFAKQDSVFLHDSTRIVKQSRRYQESRARLVPLLYEAYRSTKIELAKTTPIKIKLMQEQSTEPCTCSCSDCSCRSSQTITKNSIDTLRGEKDSIASLVHTSAEEDKPKNKEAQESVPPKLTRVQTLLSQPAASYIELFRSEQIDSLIRLENEFDAILAKKKGSKALLDSLRTRCILASNLATLWSDAKEIDRVLAGDTLTLPSYITDIIDKDNYTMSYYLDHVAPGLAEEYLLDRVAQYKRMQGVQRDFLQHLVALEALASAEDRLAELMRYKEAYPPEQTAPYHRLDSLRRVYSRVDEGTDYLAGIFALCRFAPEEMDLALLDALKLLDHKISNPTERLNSVPTEAYHRQGNDVLLARHIFSKAFKVRYPEKTYTPITRQVIAEIEKCDYDRTKFPQDYPSFTSLLAKAVIEKTSSLGRKKQ